MVELYVDGIEMCDNPIGGVSRDVQNSDRKARNGAKMCRSLCCWNRDVSESYRGMSRDVPECLFLL